MFDRKFNELNRLFCHQNTSLNNFDAMTGEMPLSHFQWDNWLKSLCRMQKATTSFHQLHFFFQQFIQSKLIVSTTFNKFILDFCSIANFQF